MRQRWRTVVATLLIVVACALAPLSVVAVWTRNQVTNTEPAGGGEEGGGSISPSGDATNAQSPPKTEPALS